MVKALAIAAVAWPMVLGGALACRVYETAPAIVATVYVAASRVCHQRPERSFHTDGVSWPVCGRCSGLYLGGAVGALVAVGALRRRRPAPQQLAWLAFAALPTAVTLGLEWTGVAAISNAVRALAALPLGALVAVVLVRTAAGRGAGIE